MRKARKKSIRGPVGGLDVRITHDPKKKKKIGKKGIPEELLREVKLLKRVSNSYFEATDGERLHTISYSRQSGYISCTCAEYSYSFTCPFVKAVRVILENEGAETHLKRERKAPWIADIETFTAAIKKICFPLPKLKWY